MCWIGLDRMHMNTTQGLGAVIYNYKQTIFLSILFTQFPKQTSTLDDLFPIAFCRIERLKYTQKIILLIWINNGWYKR